MTFGHFLWHFCGTSIDKIINERKTYCFLGFNMKKIGLIVLISFALTAYAFNVVSQAKADTPYEVIKRTFTYAPEFRPEGRPNFTSDIYFSQSYFEHSSYEYDSHLATTSLCLAVTTYPDYGIYDEEGWYEKQPKFIKNTLETIGFNSFTTNDDFVQTARMDSIGLAAAKKEFSDYTVIAVAPRSGGYYSEWANNMHLGDGSKSDYMHEGWYNAANKLIDFVVDYVSEHQISGRVKLWMTGFSRGGATVNISAGLIDARLDNGEKILGDRASLTKEDVYAYTFEAPQGANVNSKTIKLPRDVLYGNIFNIVNPNDVVPKVAMAEYGFTRFGVDKYITTRFYDPKNFESNRYTFKKLHDLANQTDEVKYSADDFAMYGLKIEDFLTVIGGISSLYGLFSGKFGQIKDNTKANYDANIAATLFIEELTSELGSRDNYVKKYQTPLENIMLIMKNENYTNIPSTPGLIARMFLLATLSNSILGNFDSVKNSIKSVAGSYATRIVELLDVLTDPLVDAYWERPNELISIAVHVGDIFQNHYSDVNLAHMQAQDSYYIDEYNRKNEEKIDVVPLRNNADFGRMKFFGFNDLGLRLESKNGTRVVNVEGHVLGKSDILQCDEEYAVGYYSYVTEEKIELFMPINRKYNISMKSYSKKPRHRCEYWGYYQFMALDNRGVKRVQLDHKKDTAYFNSDRFKRDVTIRL